MVKEAAGYRHRQNNKLIAICIAPFGAFQAYNYFVNTVTTRSSHVTMQRRKHPLLTFCHMILLELLPEGNIFFSFARSFEAYRELFPAFACQEAPLRRTRKCCPPCKRCALSQLAVFVQWLVRRVFWREMLTKLKPRHLQRLEVRVPAITIWSL